MSTASGRKVQSTKKHLTLRDIMCGHSDRSSAIFYKYIVENEHLNNKIVF